MPMSALRPLASASSRATNGEVATSMGRVARITSAIQREAAYGCIRLQNRLTSPAGLLVAPDDHFLSFHVCRAERIDDVVRDLVGNFD